MGGFFVSIRDAVSQSWECPKKWPCIFSRMQSVGVQISHPSLTMSTVSKVRRNVRRLTEYDLQTIATVLDSFVCGVNDTRLAQLYKASCRTSRALAQDAANRGEPLTEDAAQFIKEEQLKRDLLRDVALRRNVPLASE